MSLVIKHPDYDETQGGLDRVFRFCQANDQPSCEAGITNYVDAMASMFSSQGSPLAEAVTREQLRLIVRDAEYCAESAALLLARGKEAPANGEAPAEGLCSMLMLDFPKTRRSVNSSDLGKLGLTREAAITVARAQVLATLPDIRKIDFKPNAVFAVAMSDVPSLMLDTAGWKAAATRYPRLTFLITVSDDSLLSIISVEDESGLDGIKRLASEDFATAERGISPLAYKWTDSGWEAVH